MALRSRLFRNDKRLQDCLIVDSAHVTPGSVGDHVKKIQTALIILDDLKIDASEVKAGTYGSSTADAVLAFKQRRKIINFSYQTAADDIVGKMTIAALDKEVAQVERTTFINDIECEFGGNKNPAA